MYNPFPLEASPWLVFLFIHLATAVALWKMAEKIKEEPSWFAFVPVLNAILLLKLAKKPLWWMVLLFLPLVNLVVLIAAMIAICERFGINKWWGLLAVVSPFNLILLLYLAFGDYPKKPTASTAHPTPSA